MSPSHDSSDPGLGSGGSFRVQSRRRVAERVPWAMAVFFAASLLGACFEWTYYPERRPVLIAVDLGFASIALVLPLVRRRPDLSIVAMIVAVNLAGIGSNLYHWLTFASAERSLLIVIAFLSTAAIILPWGWRAQALASIGPLASYLASLVVAGEIFGRRAGVDMHWPAVVLFVYPCIVMGLGILGAALIDRYLRSDFLLTRALREREIKLAQAKAIAEAASRSKTDFLASMSHEIRTPMNVIFGMTDMALDSELSPEQRSYLLRARGAANTLLVLVNDILDFARIESGKLSLQRRRFGLRAWLLETLEPLAWLARDKDLDVTWTTADDVAEMVVGDPDRLGQVLVNLVTNAIKFTNEGSVRIYVARADGGQEARHHLHFWVADTGVGIPAAQQHHVFEAFVQGESARSLRADGAGLGLAICTRLVRLMAGQIWVDSEPGKGSRFHFTAHLEPAAHVSGSDPDEPASIAAAPGSA